MYLTLVTLRRFLRVDPSSHYGDFSSCISALVHIFISIKSRRSQLDRQRDRIDSEALTTSIGLLPESLADNAFR